ncbi:MAG: hypothetical protein GEV12_08530 [Micromonosporaceae bacterium]|nr:hypothetical protein [Micromonosporaceae bacterium]
MSAHKVFHLMRWAWDVTEGHRLATGYPIHQVDITVLAGMAGLIGINPAHLERVDLARPLLLAPVPELGNLVIDGWHRVHQALRTGITHLPARLLTSEDEQRIRIKT